MLPTLADQVFTQLRSLTLIGIKAVKKEGAEDPLEYLKPRVKVEYRPGGVTRLFGHKTPFDISPPNGPFTS